ncbi:MAG: lipocalin family protein [Brumimicrobium sp.]
MKLLYKILLSIFSIFILIACENSNDNNSEENENKSTVKETELTPSENISQRWVLVKRTNTKKDKTMDYDEQNSSVITFFEDNGYFRIYDSLVNMKKDQGIRRIEQRQSGQWEIDKDKLILRYTESDTVIIEEMTIQKLDKKELQLKSDQKDQINYYKKKQ